MNSRQVQCEGMKSDVELRRRHLGVVHAETREIRNEINLTEDMIISMKEQILESNSKLKLLEDSSRVNEADLERWATVNEERLADEELMKEYARKDSYKFKALQGELENLLLARNQADRKLGHI